MAEKPGEVEVLDPDLPESAPAPAAAEAAGPGESQAPLVLYDPLARYLQELRRFPQLAPEEERELDESRTRALGDIDAKIEEQRLKLEAGVLDPEATAAEEHALDAQAAEHTAAIHARSDDDGAARNVRGAELGMAAREKARVAGEALVGDAENKAKDMRARGVADAEKIRAEGETRMAFHQTQADQHQADALAAPLRVIARQVVDERVVVDDAVDRGDRLVAHAHGIEA